MEIDTHELMALLQTIRKVYGYDFTDYAEASLKRRVVHFMSHQKIEDFGLLERILLTNEDTFEQFILDISVTVTEMFRDPVFFKSLRENVMKRLSTYPFIKVWIAGCATGEEAYSVAILLKEEGLLKRSVIYSTDINQQSLKKAKDGIFPLESMKAYTANYQKSGGINDFSQYYKAKYNSALFDSSLRESMVFSPHNLAVDRSFNEFQLIVCRNVMIYFNQQLQNRVITLFHESLCPFGYLALGSKESLLFSDRKKCFGDVDHKEKIYIKNK